MKHATRRPGVLQASFLATRAFFVASVLLLTLGCSFDDHPSFGRHPSANAPHSGDPSAAGADNGVDARATAGEQAPSMHDVGLAAGSSTGALAGAFAQGPAGAPAITQPEPPARSCIPAMYAVQLQCEVDVSSLPAPLAPPVIPSLNAQLALLMRQSPNRGALEFSDVDLKLPFEIPYDAYWVDMKMAGQLDCGRDAFSAEIVEGASASFFGLPIVLLTGGIEGRRDIQTQQLAGEWWFGQAGGPLCIGTWNATPM